MKTVPISLITGYLGSGKTTLINNILNNKQGYKIAVIVNDIGEVNLDAELIQKGGVVSLTNDSLVALQNGCICCNLNEDLIKQLLNLSQSGKFDHIVIEASGICEPMPIVQSIVAIEEECERRGIPRVCKLDAVISVTDALRLAKEFGCGENLKEENIDEEDIENLIIQQIEFCDCLILNKIDEVSTEELNHVKAVVRELQPTAKIIETNYSQVDIDEILDVNIFDYEKSFTGAGWLKAMESETELTNKTHHGEHKSEHDKEHEHHHHESHEHNHHEDHEEEHHHEHHHEDEEDEVCEHCGHHHHGHCHHEHEDGTTCEEYGVSTFVYFRREPMDRNKFLIWANKNFGREIIRTKGLVYFNDELDMSYLFEQAGTQKNLTQSGLWFATMPKNELNEMLQNDANLRRDWDDNFGDRMIKLVFIGQKMDKNKIIEELNNI